MSLCVGSSLGDVSSQLSSMTFQQDAAQSCPSALVRKKIYIYSHFMTVSLINCHASRFLNDTLLLSAGQTVELLERPSERPGWCLVRTTERTPPQEGLVPSSVLCVSHSRSSVEMDCFFSSGKGRKDKPEVQINSGFSFCKNKLLA